MSSEAPMGRGRGRARARGHRSTSPRPLGTGSRGSNSPEEHLAMIDRPVRPGSQSPPGATTKFPDVAGQVGALSLHDPNEQRSTSQSNRGTTRGARPFGHDDPSTFKDFLVRSRTSELENKRGTRGDPMKMITNYFRLKRAPMWTLYEYHMVSTPVVDEVKMKKALLRHNQEAHGLSGYIFDGTKIYTATKLATDPFQFDAVLESHGNRENREEVTERRHFKVVLKFHHTLDPGDPGYMHFYQVILRSCLFGMGLNEMGRHFYDADAAIKLPQQKLDLWPGYITSLRQHEQDVLLCVETTHKVLRTDSVLATIKSLQQTARGGAMDAIRDQLKDAIVMTTYNRQTYKITDVDFKTNPTCTFETKNGPISYMDYYGEKGYNITDRTQPMLVAKPSKKDLHRGVTQVTNLIPEFCQFTGLTDAMRENFTLMKELSKYLHVGPQDRVKEIMHFMQRLSSKKDLTETLDKWGLAFDQKLSSVEGRTLACEKMIFATGEETADNKGDWTKAFRSQKMLTAVNLTKWVVIVPQRDAPGVDNLTRTMTKVAGPLNMRIANPMEVLKINDVKGPSYVKAINEMVEKYPDLQMLFVILPFNKTEPYGSVKKRLAVEYGIPSQCFVSKNVNSKGLMSIATKVVVQMNAKLGGEPWSIKLPLKKLMVVGYDVYHGAKGSQSGSIGAMVATISPTLSKYYSTTSVFNRNTGTTSETVNEFSKTMLNDFTKCLRAYQEENGELPDRIFMFRDGVGEGQLQLVYQVELTQLQQAMINVYEKNDLPVPKFTFIVVTKKINSRIILDRGGRYDNPAPGTIVDDVITIPERYDFFLISCAARQGTVSPCNYNVLYDSQGLDVDKIQMITYKMCHMYFNWSGTVAVPAPCQYAHKLAFITGMSYQGAAHGKLSKLLHFL